MSGPWAICPRCWFRRRDANLRMEWTGIRVCSDCWDTRPPWLDPPRINPMEAAPIPDARLDQDANSPTFTDDNNPITADDL